ncbi:pectin lyase fold/virulence factor [Dactylonectria macrodidyma]|uniref:Pectin lyase fold/virulence factor n=1 Tax=Dactylonectria macrodidyma TaxID=307937 RepID=A0A9P9J1D2_9HYPO|nr:pectin lyase fold/virulence factor [Dactylonectria macrodidyma]
MLSNCFLKSAAAAYLIGVIAAEPIPATPDRVRLNPWASTCTPQAGGSSTVDDVPAIQSAIEAYPSGIIVIPSGKTGCTLGPNGELSASTNFDYWNAKGEIVYLQNINGATITGLGAINGNGQASWDYIVTNTTHKRPYLICVDGSTNIKMSGITIKDSPSFHVVTSGNSKNVVYSGLTLYSVSNSSNAAHNTDGFDIGPASYVTVENTKVTNDDDCVVLKPGASALMLPRALCLREDQVEYNPWTLDIEGIPGTHLLQTARELGIATVAYSPLAAGDEIIPIPGTKKIEYLEENTAALNFQLTEEDVKELRNIVDAADTKDDRGAGGVAFADTPEL